MELTIASVTFNCISYTKLFLESLKKYAGVPYRLIVVDNHSTDGTVKFLKKQKNLTLILNKRNLGFGWANNQAFRLCKTPYFLGINNDTVIFPGFLPRLLQIAEAHPKFGEFGVHSNCIGALDPRTGKDTRIGLSLETHREWPKVVVKQYYGDFGQFFEQFRRKNPGILEFEVPLNSINYGLPIILSAVLMPFVLGRNRAKK